MQDAAFMGVVDCGRNRLQVRRRLLRGPRALADLVRQRLARDIVHREVVLALMFADFMDGNDIGVLKVCDCLRFGVEAFKFGRAGENPSPYHFQRHRPVETSLARLVHHSHAAAAEHVLEFVSIPQIGSFYRHCFCSRNFRDIVLEVLWQSSRGSATVPEFPKMTTTGRIARMMRLDRRRPVRRTWR